MRVHPALGMRLKPSSRYPFAMLHPQVVFRAGEMRTVSVYVDRRFYDSYQYYFNDGIYEVFGLCYFRTSGSTLIGFRDIGVTLIKKE